MDDNLLTVGTPRVGWFVDGVSESPESAAMLEDTGKGIVLTLPLKGIADKGEPYSRWFEWGHATANSSSSSKNNYAPPDITAFYDKDGPVVLIGCRSQGFSRNLRAGVGRIVANFAVLGGRRLNYSKIHGLRSELPALGAWSGITSIQTEPTLYESGRVKGLSVNLNPTPETHLSRSLNLKLRPTWRTSTGDDVGMISAHDVLQLETSAVRARGWEEHLTLHEAVRELLVLSSWSTLGFSRLYVSRNDDPKLNPRDNSPLDRWSRVATHRVRIHQPWNRPPRFLFEFGDIGPQGVGRWLKLRSQLGRVFQPLIGLRDEPNTYGETDMLMVGISLEALGFYLAQKHGMQTGKQLRFSGAVQYVLDDMSYIPLDDPEDWASRTRRIYTAIKHADNPYPDSLDLLNTARECILVIRVWLAQQLGCPSRVLKQRVSTDPLADAYVLLS